MSIMLQDTELTYYYYYYYLEGTGSENIGEKIVGGGQVKRKVGN